MRLARERLAEARALNQSALLQFFPWLSAGIVYRRHDNLQNTEGVIEEVHKQSYAPGGALVSQLDLGDAIYNKLAARQLEHASEHALEAQRQDTVATAAQGYFDLAFAHASVGVSEEAVRISTNYEAQVRHAVESGGEVERELLHCRERKAVTGELILKAGAAEVTVAPVEAPGELIIDERELGWLFG